MSELDPKSKYIIQIVIAIGITLLFQFVLPSTWQPFYNIVGDVFGSEAGSGIAELSLWFFALSVSWLIYRDNPYLNSLFMYSLIPLGAILVFELAFYFLFWDFVHILPFLIGIYVLLKKRDTLKRKYILLFTFALTGWIFLAYYLGLAYSVMSILFLALGLSIQALIMLQIASWVTHIPHPKKSVLKRIFKGFIVGIWIFGVFLGSVLLYWYLRPTSANIDNSIVMRYEPIVTGQHNSNTDLCYFNGSFWLIHDKRPYHFGSGDPKLILWNSSDGFNWNKVREFSGEGEDIRDPKFVVIGSKLFLYALKNVGVIASPYKTVYTYTTDGVNWTAFQDINHPGWLFWRPKTNDNITWYVPAYWHEHGESKLLNSTDGITWNETGTIYVGEANDETAIEFLSDGRMICTARLEGAADTMFGSSSGSTLIATSSYPYTNWSSNIKSQVTRLDGPVLFTFDNKTFAVGRQHLGPRTYFTELGSVFSRKRTSLYLVNETTGLTYLTDLPSQGDTSYAGVVINGTELYVSYYTSDIRFDYSWLLGMVSDSDIYMAKINLTALNSLAESLS